MTTMKRKFTNVLTGVVGASLAACLWSCSAEAMFEEAETGTVYLHTAINNITTRSIEGYTDDALADNCMIYISRKNGTLEGDSKTKDGLVYKEQGIKHLKSKITLNAGHYAAEAWTGDSVAADFDKKYFKAYQDFNVTKGGVCKVELTCKIQNSIVMIDNSNLDKLPMKDYTITITSSAGGEPVPGGILEFNSANITKKGYFMMPADETGTLSYTIEGTKTLDNQTFTYSGTIENVKRTYTYVLKFGYNPSQTNQTGGASLEITVDETETEGGNEEASIPTSAPTIEGVGFSLGTSESETTALNYTDDNSIPSEIAIKVCAVGDIKTLTITRSNIEGAYDLLAGTNFPDGISLQSKNHDNDTNVTAAFVTISKGFITKLGNGVVHTFTISASDTEGKESTAVLKIER